MVATIAGEPVLARESKKGGTARAIGIVTLVGLLCNALLLPNMYGLYFEDFTLYNKTALQIAQYFGNRPFLFEEFLITSLHRFCPLQYWRALAVLFNILEGVLLYFSFCKSKLFGSNDAVAATALYLSLPIYAAKISVLLFPRLIIRFVFLAGITLFIYAVKNRHKSVSLSSYRVLGFILLLVALEFPALVPIYYIIVFGVIASDFRRSGGGWCAEILKSVIMYIDFLLLPFASFALNAVLVHVQVIYENLYSVTTTGLISAIVKTPDALLHNLLGVFDIVQLIDSPTPYVAIFLAVLIGVYFSLPQGRSADLSSRAIGVGLVFSVALMFAAIFPYLSAGKQVLYEGWSSKNQFLLPFGAAIFFVFLLKLIPSKRLYYSIICAVVSLCIVSDNQTWLSFYRDWVKRSAFVYSISNDLKASEATNFVVYDQCKFVNGARRDIPYSEYYCFVNSELMDGHPRFFYGWEVHHLQDNNFPWLQYDSNAKLENLHVCEITYTRPLSLFNYKFYELWKAEMSSKKKFRALASNYFSVAVYPVSELFQQH